MKLNGEGLYFLWDELGVNFEKGVAFGFGCQDCELDGGMIFRDGQGELAE
jgi:hypothetical protein